MKTKVIGITETSRDVWRVTINGSVLGDSRGYDRAGALAEAKRYVERNGGIDGDWGPDGWVEMRNVLDPALEPKAEEVPAVEVALVTEESAAVFARFHAWFDGIKAEAAATEQGQAFIAAGFELDHTGGGCTAWRREIEGAGKYLMITDADGCNHTLTAEDIDYFGNAWLCGVHDETLGYSDCRAATKVEHILEHADAMAALVVAGDLAAIGWNEG